MNKILSRIAIALASFAMVIGGVSTAAIYSNKEQVKLAYAEEEKKITFSEGYDVFVGDDFVLTATPNFTATGYTWSSSNESIATVTWIDNVCTVHGVSEGGVNITVNAQWSGGVISAKKYLNVTNLSVSTYSDVIEMQPCSSIRVGIGWQHSEGAVVCTAVADDPNIVSMRAHTPGSGSIILDAGPYENVSTTLTITAKDNNGQPGCHTDTYEITVNVGHYYTAGNRVTTLPQMGNETPVLLANSNKTKFVSVDPLNGYLVYTDDIRQVTLFSINDEGYILYGNPIYEDTGGINCLVIESSGPFFDLTNFGGCCFNRYFYDVANWDYDNGNNPLPQLYVDYPGILIFSGMSPYDAEYMVIYSYENHITSNMGYPSNNTEPLFAYEATNERIVPETTSRTAPVDSSFDVKINTMFVDSLTYEVTSGEECLDDVDVSNITANAASLIISTSDVRGTAVVRVKDADHPDLYYADITITVTRDHGVPDCLCILDTQAQLSYHYSKDEYGQFTYSNVSMRFGAVVDKTTWATVDSSYEDITGFGVMITASNAYPDAFAFNNNLDKVVSADSTYDIDTDIVDYFMARNEMEVPPSLDNDNYAWNLFLQIPESDFGKVYYACAYVKVEDEYYFLWMASYSVYTLAEDYIDNRHYNQNTADGSLYNLAQQA